MLKIHYLKKGLGKSKKKSRKGVNKGVEVVTLSKISLLKVLQCINEDS
jgi:hypothetical protein